MRVGSALFAAGRGDGGQRGAGLGDEVGDGQAADPFAAGLL